MSHVFGPVPSRRLGRSLGVDLVPFKTCSYDCIYCQLGTTTAKTCELQEWVPLDEVMDGIAAKLSSKPDWITLSGSGEPTLFSRTGELIDRIKALTDIPVAVLTNGSLLWQAGIREQLIKADLVIPSLDAGSEVVFKAVNRPHPQISFERMLQGLVDFRHEFRGEYWLEVFLLAGYTTVEPELSDLVNCIERINPGRIQLNTIMRPPAEEFAVGVTRERMEEIAQRFDPPAEIIAEFQGPHGTSEFAAGRQDILDLVSRRPCTVGDIASGLGMHRNEVVKYVEDLVSAGSVSVRQVGDSMFYAASK